MIQYNRANLTWRLGMSIRGIKESICRMGLKDELKTGIRLTRKNIIMMIFSICLSIVGVLTISLFRSSLSKNVIHGLNAKIITLGHFALLVMLIIVFYGLLHMADRLVYKSSIYKTGEAVGKQKIFKKVFIINLAYWGVWFWLYFPGAGMNDTINCIMSFNDDIQPLTYQLIIYYGIHFLTNLTNNMTISYAILVVLHMILMSIIIAQLVCWLNKKRIKSLYINIIIIYYAFSPAVADYSITLVKDVLFSLCIATVIPLVYELVEQYGEAITNKKFYFSFLASLLGISIIRSNGKYIAIIILLLLMITKIKNKKYILSLIIFLFVINTSLSACEKNLKTNNVNFREAIGVPLAQVGAVLVTDGFISETDRETLNNLLPLDVWKEGYSYSFADSIKFNGNFNNQWLNENKGKFLSSWFSLLENNFGTYVKAYLCHTYGFWNISPLNITSIYYPQSYFRRINNNTGDDSYWGEFCKENNLENCEISFGSVREQVDAIFQVEFRFNLILGAGIMLWLCVWCIIELFIYKKYRVCLVFMPILLNWATLMVASPASFIYRYSFYLILSLPLLFMITLMQINNNKINKQIGKIVGEDTEE